MQIKYSDLKKSSPLPAEKFDFLAGESLNFSREKLFMISSSLELSANQVKKIKKNQALALAGTPPEYIFKKAYFAGNEFYVDKNVLIPRPETETLIQEATNFLINKKNLKILDLGTGCGCIAITLKKLFPKADVTASDVSSKALKNAKKNAKKQKVQIEFIQSDLFREISGQYDLILANLPYVDEKDALISNLADPMIAFNGGKNGFAIIKKALKKLPKFLKQDGLAIFEFAYNHEKMMREIAQENALKVRILKDLNDFTRFGLVYRDK